MSPEMALQNIRILDFSWVLAGPYATRTLADFGAEVIKIQPQMSEADDSFSRGYYNTWNRNKLGISLNLNDPRGIEIAKNLVKVCDVVVENFSPRVMKNWGLEYPDLKIIKPDLIYCSMSLMGHSGPWQGYTGFGPTVQAFSGTTGLTAYPDKPPSGIGFSYADHTAGLYASLAILGALEYKRKTGLGQYVDLSEYETMTSLLADSLMEYSREGLIKDQNRGSLSGVYRCKGEDRWCAISFRNEAEWQGLITAIGNPAWTAEVRFSNPENRSRNSAELNDHLTEWTLQHSSEEVMQILQKQGAPAGVVQNADDLAKDPQLNSRGFWIELEYPEMDKNTADASPIRLSETPADYKRSAPAHGRDNEYVYGQLLGLSRKEISQLEKDKVI
jgi:benzylsuccinate CoA-transferase BbsF subunit